MTRQRKREPGGRLRRLIPRMAVTILLMAVSSIELAGSASASNHSGASGSRTDCSMGPGGINMQDPNPHTYYYSALEHTTQIHIDWSRNNVFNPTSIDTTYPGGVSSLTDVVVYDNDYSTFCFITWHSAVTGTGAVGAVICVSLASGNRCEKHEQRHDTSWWLSPNVTDLQRRHNACHEGGHALGLMHAEDHPAAHQTTCMFTGQWASDFISWHDLMHINGGSWMLRWDGSLALPSTLYEGQAMSSPNGAYRLWMQGDGNLVLYGPSGAVWADGQNNPWSNWLVMQSDGNVVHYVSDGWGTWPVWSTNTAGPYCSGAWFKVQDDGNMIVAAPPDTAKWTRFNGNVGACR
jgi:hypothetical protein